MPACSATWTDHDTRLPRLPHDHHACVFASSPHRRHECRCGLNHHEETP